MLSLYVPGNSVVHRLPAGTKLLLLVGAGVALFAIEGVAVHAGELLAVACLFGVARLPWRDALHQLRPALLFLVPIFLFHVFLTDWVLGVETVLRILVLLLLAVLVTLTTKLSDMIDVLERATRPPSPCRGQSLEDRHDAVHGHSLHSPDDARGPGDSRSAAGPWSRSQRDCAAGAAAYQDAQDGR